MTTQHVEVLNLPGKFTSIAVEAVEEGQAEDFKTIVDRVCQELSCQRSPLHPQLVGLGWSKQPIFIVYDELINGDKYTEKIWAEKKWIVYCYLLYTHNSAFQALHGNNTLTFPVLSKWNLWTFNLRTHTWQYDVSSVVISPPNNNTSLLPIIHPSTPLCQDTCPQLNTDEIVACFEDHFGDLLHFGDFLQAIASFGQTRHVKDLSDFARHGLLTFGAIINCKKTKILAYFQSTIAPTWHCKSFSTNIEASYSTSVPSRVDLSFRNTDSNQVNFHFSLRYPDPLHRRTAYLSQSLPFIEDCDVPEEDLISVDDVRFSLIGTLHHNPTTSSPAYLFVPPIPLEKINDIPMDIVSFAKMTGQHMGFLTWNYICGLVHHGDMLNTIWLEIIYVERTTCWIEDNMHKIIDIPV
ncbi:hypothetical protein PQX77_015427 [Marasmius sp. AFHP31]|nr:hypothetical protein PQX77_015427 [Marasmius sp. AFHP31]